MKREEILFYLSEGKLSLYFTGAQKEKTLDVDTSLFFQCGEISNVSKGENALTQLLAKIKFNHSYLKPDLVVLYNDVCRADMKHLYCSVLRGFSYNTIRFVRLSRIARSISKEKNVVVFDKNYYTLIDRGEKTKNDGDLGENPIIIGKCKTPHVHYPDEDIIWKTLKSCFTNVNIYDNIDVGDDVL